MGRRPSAGRLGSGPQGPRLSLLSHKWKGQPSSHRGVAVGMTEIVHLNGLCPLGGV